MTIQLNFRTLSLFLFLLGACSSSPTNSTPISTPPQTQASLQENNQLNIQQIAPQEPLVVIAGNTHSNQHHPSTPQSNDAHDSHKNTKKESQHQDSEHHREAGPVSPETALGWLKNGNIRYLKNKLRNDGQSTHDRQRLSTGQKPHTIVLSCSDSRVPPEIVFDQKLGEIFVVRAAGQALDSSVIASIEYAVSHLGSNLILVMGHDSCGAVKAAHATLQGDDAGSTSLNKLVGDIHPRIAQFNGKPLTPNVNDETWANVRGVAKDLIVRSQIVRDLVTGGDVKIAEAVYHLQSGQVEWK